ncbi:glycerophosphodiester phosphodiesterase family protein [Luteolibacter luteus]|uniref:Glycerophosphodiester phosphodiesterase n=1 Tax=Luteolibacter luteus TaxID=2728835 RepID=A0A858RNE1_9BACT|nr:glycerophosphodiester phosphodiesterase family protein [Luteolibacter luteus]QJE98024.1 glycerophosphodiester phosphodiesterase [Luteolibacter luteus]
MKRKNALKRSLISLGLLLVFVYFNNASWLAAPTSRGPLLLAHRGMSQTFDMAGVGNDTDTSKRIHPPEHPYLENTIASMESAFAHGADVVEFDIHPTTDGHFAVFHDWILDYRTNGEGVTREHSLSDLQKLDVGYGYTADDGRTFPFRGKGIGLMPSLDQVLAKFPDKSLLIHIKSNDPEEGRKLAAVLKALPQPRRALLAVYGGDSPIQSLRGELPDLRTMSKATLKKGVLSYIATGWTGYVPDSCRHTQIHIPEKYAPILWGWPDRFLSRMEKVGTRVILVGGEGEFSAGFDRVEDLKRLPEGYRGGIWTNRIDRIAPSFGRSSSAHQ